MTKKSAPSACAEAPFAPEDMAAIKAVNTGTANDAQQIRAINWIIYTLCRTYDQPYRPGEGGDRDTVFACAKQFVGQQIVKLTKLIPPEKRGS